MLSGQKKLSMDKKLLTVLGCSGSVALTLLSSNPAQANSEREYVFNAPELESEIVEVPYSDTDYPFYDCSCSEYNAAEVEALDRELRTRCCSSVTRCSQTPSRAKETKRSIYMVAIVRVVEI